MRISMRITINRILGLGASALLAGSLAVATSGTAYAADKITVTNPGTQTTNPLSTAVSLQIKAADSVKSTLTYAAAGLPAGLTISKTTGLISGTITAAKTYSVKVTVTDAKAATGSASFTWTAGNTVTITNPGTQSTAVGAPVALAILAADDDKATALAWSAAGLPPGLAINAVSGIITGAPTTPGTSTVTVKVVDKDGSGTSATFTWKVANLVTVTAPGTERSTVSVAITPVTVTATDSTKGEPITFTAANLPPGLAISAAGKISGTPTGKAGNYTVTVTGTDGTGATGRAPIGWTVANLVTVPVPTPKQWWVGIRVSLTVKAIDSDPAQRLTYTATGLPGGMSINPATGLISGTPGKIAAGAVTVTATDGVKSVGTATFRWLVGEPIQIPAIGRVPINAGLGVTVHVRYVVVAPHDQVTLQAHGLPHGMTFNAGSGTIFGWPTAPGTHPVTIVAHGSRGDSRAMVFPLVVKPDATAGQVGQLRLDLGGKCLDDTGQTTGGSTKVVLSTCQSGAPQSWTLVTDGTIRVGSRCLEVSGSSNNYLGKTVQLWGCAEGAARETWVTGAAGQLINSASGLCLADASSSTVNGVVPALVSCRVTPSQVWIMPATRLLSGRAGKCADDLHSSGVDGNPVDMFSCNGTNSQDWSFGNDFTVRIFGNKCLTDPGKLGVAGVKIQLWTCAAGDKGQKVVVVPTGGLSSELTIDGVCVAIPSMTAANTSSLITGKCSATDPDVHWHIW
jgi:Ricin-type beta-trefoil lectin domain/Putative Ig domain